MRLRVQGDMYTLEKPSALTHTVHALEYVYRV